MTRQQANVQNVTEKIKALAPPKIKKNLRNHTVRVGDQLILDVSATGNPSPKFKWFYNNYELRTSESIKIIHGDHSSRLILGKPLHGTYKAVADNGVGTASTSGEITLIDGKNME